jgi:hypothetical protein
LKSATKKRTRFYNGELHFYPEEYGFPKFIGPNKEKFKTIYLADTYSLIPKKLKMFKEMFGLDIHKQQYPYKYYTFQRMKNNIGDINEVAQVENWNEKQKQKFYATVIKSGSLLRDEIKHRVFNTKFNMEQYCKFYCNHDVLILKQGFVKFAKFLKSELNISVIDYLTISSLSYDYITRQCLEKIPNLKLVGGHVKEFM